MIPVQLAIKILERHYNCVVELPASEPIEKLSLNIRPFMRSGDGDTGKYSLVFDGYIVRKCSEFVELKLDLSDPKNTEEIITAFLTTPM